jgi:uncharacterized protein with gpF-like domain
MATRDEDEAKLGAVVATALQRWLNRARDAVMAPFRQHGIQPDPTAIYSTQPLWNLEVETILTTIGQISLGVWSQATDVPPVSRHAFVVAYLADVRNLLVRIPDETANLVFAEINDGVNAGESLDQLAARVDRVLSYTGSERWPGRARTIAVTEVTRAYGAATMAAGVEQSRITGRRLNKTWRTSHDERVRMGHREADGQTVPVFMPFQVEGEALQFPGDPSGSPENVINCRCDLIISNEEGR